MKRNLLLLQILVAGLGVMIAFVGGAMLALENPFGANLIGIGFALVGAGFAVPRYLAMSKWQEQEARVTKRIDDSDTPTLEFVYEFGGKQYHGAITLTTTRMVGDTVPIQVNPKNPAEHIDTTALPIVLGLIFMIVGAAIALHGPKMLSYTG